MAGERRTKSYLPLQISVGAASQMILPPVAGQLDNTAVPEWTTGNPYVYGDIVRYEQNYYWCITASGNAGATPPTHSDGDASDDTLTWRKVRWHRDVVTLTNIESAGQIAVSRGTAAELNKGIVLFTQGALNEGYDGPIRPYQGAWYAISDGTRALAISEG